MKSLNDKYSFSQLKHFQLIIYDQFREIINLHTYNHNKRLKQVIIDKKICHLMKEIIGLK